MDLSELGEAATFLRRSKAELLLLQAKAFEGKICVGAGHKAEWLNFCLLHSGSLGLQVQILSAGIFHSSAMLWRHLTYKVENDWHRC